MNVRPIPSRLTLPLLTAAVATIYYGSARLGLLLAFENTNASPVWPPSGIAFATLLLFGYRTWPGITIGAFAANVVVFLANQAASLATVLSLSFFIAAGNTLEALTGVFLLNRLVGAQNPFDHAHSVFRFVVIALIMCLVSSIVGATGLSIAEIAPWEVYETIWFTWWLGDVSGVLILTPLLVAWWKRPEKLRDARSLFEIALLLSALFVVAQMTFEKWLPSSIIQSQVYLLIPFLLWAAFRFGQRQTTLAILVVSGVATWATVRGAGPFFVEDSLNTSLLLLQSFVCIVAVTMLSLVAVLTERRHAGEEQLRQSQKIEAVGQLTAGIAHNFNNMLQAITGSLEIAIADAPETMRRHLLDADRASRRGAEIVRQLMLFMRTAGPAESKPVEIEQILEDTVAICRRTFDRRIDISFNPPGSLPTVIGDAGHLHQVFLNICLNARDALEGIVRRDPCIRVEVDAPRPEANQPRNLSVRVVDNGCGIANEDQGQVFEPFFTTKEVGKGTGLGLSTAFAIVRQHNGSLTCESQVGVGTTFTVQLPAVGIEAERGRREAGDVVPIGTETILLIDDEEVIRSSVSAFLSRLGYTVLLGEDGKRGVEVYEQNADEVDLVLLDLSMPHMSGREVLRALRELDSDVKVIIFTGYPLDAREFEGTISVLLKPVKAQEMALRVREELDAG